MQRSTLTVAFLMPLLAILTIGIRTIHADGQLENCQKFFGPGISTYTCQVQTTESDTPFSDCATVETSSDEIFHIGELLGADFSCECKAPEKDRPGSAHFGKSDKKFICAGSAVVDHSITTDAAIGLEGKLKGDADEVTGQGVVLSIGATGGTDGSFSFVYSCQRTTSCVVVNPCMP